MDHVIYYWSSVWIAAKTRPLCVLLIAVLPFSGLAIASDKKIAVDTDPRDSLPSIVIIVADDLGWNDLGYQGSEIRTPVIDSLAGAGLQLHRFYVQPGCSPTRASLMTGSSSLRLGVNQPLSKLNERGLPLDQRLLPEFLQEAGYQTALVGKWHLGFRQRAYRPGSRGFEHFYGQLTGGIGYWDHVHGGALDWQRNEDILRESGYSTHLLADEAERLINQRDTERPLFMVLSFNAPHLPNEAPEEAVAGYEFIESPKRRVHAAMVTEMDRAIGRVVAALEQQKMLEDTLIWFMSDNGGANSSAFSDYLVSIASALEGWFEGQPVPVRQIEFIKANIFDGAGDNRPLRKAKRSIYEGGVRVPSFIYWKNQLDPRLVKEMVTVQDVTPTLLSFIADEGKGSEFDGVNRWPMLESEETAEIVDFVVKASEGEALYRYPWKLIRLDTGIVELYELESDPLEQKDGANHYPGIVAALSSSLDSVPRGESVHLPFWKALLSPDSFGGKELDEPWLIQVR